MWVYPNQVISNQNWAPNTGFDLLQALGEDDGRYIYNTAPTNSVELGMPEEVVNCELRVQGNGSQATPTLVLNFYRAGTQIDSISIPTTNDWETSNLIVDRWDSVELIAVGNDSVDVDFLRAEPYGGYPTKRTLTGVGI
jgi:hypothetical protein